MKSVMTTVAGRCQGERAAEAGRGGLEESEEEFSIDDNSESEGSPPPPQKPQLLNNKNT